MRERGRADGLIGGLGCATGGAGEGGEAEGAAGEDDRAGAIATRGVAGGGAG